MAGPAALRLVQVAKHYAARPVLEAVDLDVAPGETVAVVGANGSGKTTLLRVAGGLVRPGSGRVEAFSQDLREASPATLRRRAFVTQEAPVYPDLDGVELLRWWGRLWGRPAPAPGDPERLLAEAGLGRAATQHAGSLSRGQRQRLALTLAFSVEPDLLILDEPAAALDAAGRAWLTARLERRRGSKATLVAVPDGEAVPGGADRAVRLHRHRLEAVA